MQQLVIIGLVVGAVSAIGASARAVDVCTYRVTASIGSPCPVSRGSQVCLSESTAIGPCDSEVQCIGGPGYFCQARMEPIRGPQRACPFGSLRPRGFRCHKPITPGAVSTATETPVAPETPTFTPTATGIPTGTASATATASATPSASPEVTVTSTLPPPATATATGIPTGTVAAQVGHRAGRPLSGR